MITPLADSWCRSGLFDPSTLPSMAAPSLDSSLFSMVHPLSQSWTRSGLFDSSTFPSIATSSADSWSMSGL